VVAGGALWQGIEREQRVGRVRSYHGCTQQTRVPHLNVLPRAELIDEVQHVGLWPVPIDEVTLKGIEYRRAATVADRARTPITASARETTFTLSMVFLLEASVSEAGPCALMTCPDSSASRRHLGSRTERCSQTAAQRPLRLPRVPIDSVDFYPGVA
jgi:hypothetical protein